MATNTGAEKPATVPCAYKTGRTLGQGTYAVVKEAVHIETGKYYACKVISKSLMRGREHMVRNEIASLKKVSVNHKGIVSLVDYFETMNNLYLVTDLCQGGELFDRICERGSYYEKDAAHIIRTVLEAVEYLHEQGIVHRDLKPENLLFRDRSEHSDLLIADFGLSRMVDDEKMAVLSTTCGTPGYMAPEIFKKTGHGKPVDMWAIGVIAYFLLCGYTPFDRNSSAEEMQAIVNADYKFEPEIYWRDVSEDARDFIRRLLTTDQNARLTASQALGHPWIQSASHVEKADQKDLLPEIKSAFNAKRTFRKAVNGIRLVNRLRTETQEHQLARAHLEQIKKQANEESDQLDQRPVSDPIDQQRAHGRPLIETERWNPRRDWRNTVRGISPIAQTLRSQARVGLTQPPDNFQETVRELCLLIENFGSGAYRALESESKIAEANQSLAQEALKQVSSRVSHIMFTPLPDVEQPTLSFDTLDSDVLDAILSQLAHSRQISTPSVLSSFLLQFLNEPNAKQVTKLAPFQKQQIFADAKNRVGVEVYTQAITQFIPKLPTERTLCTILIDLGVEGVPSMDVAKAILLHFQWSSFSSMQVAELLASLFSASQSTQFLVANIHAVMRALSVLDTSLSFAKVLREIDFLDQVSLTPSLGLAKALMAFFSAAPPAASLNNASDSALAGLWGAWTHRLRQLQLLYSLLVLLDENLVFLVPLSRRVLRADMFTNAPSAVQAQANDALDTTWNSLDLIETLMELAGGKPGAEDSAEVGKAVSAILERGIKTHAELVLLALVQLPQSTSAVHPELVSKLFGMFLAGHKQQRLVFWQLWHATPSIMLDLLVRVYHESPLQLSQIVEVAQELNFLTRLLEMRPVAFALDVAAYASRREWHAMEPFLQNLLKSNNETHLIHATLDFLETKVKSDLMRRDPQVEPTFVPLNVQSVATILRVLRANGDSMTPEEIEHFKVVRNMCLQLHPRLMSLTPGTESNEPGLTVASFSKDIHREADSWYRKMYEEKATVDEIIALLQRCKTSSDPHDHHLFACMVHTLFDEHRWFELYYPPRELLMTAVVFGSLIQYQLIESIPLGIAVRYVLDALRSPPDSTMFHFGVQALMRFQTRLAEWPQLCQALLALPQLQQTHPELISFVTHALTNAKLGKVAHAPTANESLHFSAFAPTKMHADSSQTRPTEEVSDKILFLLNNLTSLNIDSKIPTLRAMIKPEILQWFAKYLVLERVSIEPNNHELYMHVLDALYQPKVYRGVLYETLVRLKALLESEKTMQSTSERTVVKNLASWLGLLTLARNKPIRYRDIGFKELLLQGHESSRLIVVIPFVCKTLEHCASSNVFQPPNPWLMAVCRLLAELYQFADLKLNLKFEIEVLFKTLHVDLQALEPSSLLLGRRPTEPTQEINTYADTNHVTQTMENLSVNETNPAVESLNSLLQDMAQYIVINPQLVAFASQAHWKRVLYVAMESAIQEIITPVVERSVTIASISTRELVSKDFAMEPDEQKMASAAHHMAQSMAGSLALVTCKEPLRGSIVSHARSLFASGGITEQQLPEQVLSILVQDNLDLACAVIEKTAMEKSLKQIDEDLAGAYATRQEFRAHGRGTMFWDNSALSHYSTTLPDLMRIAPPGLQPQQLRVYESLMLPTESRDMEVGAGDSYGDLAATMLSPAQTLERFLPLAAKLEQFFAEVGDSQSLASLPPNHFVRQVSLSLTELVQVATPRDEAILILAQKVVQLLYKSPSRLARDVWVALLEQLCEQSAQVAKEVTAWLVFAEDERKFNVPVTMALVRSNLIAIADEDKQLAKLLVRTQFRPSVVEFCASFASECLREKLAGRGQLQGILTALSQAVQYNRASPNVTEVLEEAQKERNELPLREQLAFSFANWVRVYQQSSNPEKAFIDYVRQLQSQNVLKGEKISSLFFRVCTEVSVDHYLKQQAVGGTLASGLYSPADTFAKMIVYMVKYHADPLRVNDEQAKVHYLTKILSIIVLVLAQAHEDPDTKFPQRPFFRLYSSLLHDLHAASNQLQSAYPSALLAIANSLNTLQPLFFPGFAFAWVSLVSHRLFLPELLTQKHPEGSAAFHRLFLAHLRFLAPFLRQAKIHDTTRLLYKATLRILLLLLHDYPEYLAEHYQSLCDVVPTNCIQLRNLILCAYPPNLQLPDPFDLSLHLSQLPESQQVPTVVYDVQSILSTVPDFHQSLSAYADRHAPPNFFTILKEAWIVPSQRTHEVRYNEPLISASVLFVSSKVLSDAKHASNNDFSNDPVMDLLANMLHELEPEGRYLLLSVAANQLRFLSQTTAYFSGVLLHLYSESPEESIREQILRVLLERVIVNRPHPWGLLYTFAQLLRVRSVPLPQAPPEIHAILEHISHLLSDRSAHEST
ncbi:CCR4-NOT core subunit cdc39 [Malassezia yamatoensis]|uniref:General negative regulator of transcription subunit 1 n=1 Tax=Malassezia yamatoensis TaxID=253288 RepID=A0AAJ5YRX8_9BASI|nr:CCR4-NOT core subunit cdc39 [Malassezia yamatoensis]